MIKMAIIQRKNTSIKSPSILGNKFINKNGALVSSSAAAAIVPLNVAHACVREFNRNLNYYKEPEAYTVIEIEVEEK